MATSFFRRKLPPTALGRALAPPCATAPRDAEGDREPTPRGRDADPEDGDGGARLTEELDPDGPVRARSLRGS